MNILFFINPDSTHDIKWAKYFSLKQEYNCFYICGQDHCNNEIIENVAKEYKLTYLGKVGYFSISKPITTIKDIISIKTLVKNYKVDLFHIQYAEPNSLWTLLKPILNIPIIITCRGTDVLKVIPNHFAKKDILNQIVKRLYKKAFLTADWITTTSTKQSESIEQFSGRKERVSVIRTGVEIHQIKKDTSNYLKPEIKKPFVLFPRYIFSIYNHEFCLKAIKGLDAQTKKDYQMVFIGKNSGDLLYQEKLIKIMNELNDVKFIFLPKLNQKQIWELYKNASLIVMTPSSDGSPVSAMESMALNKKTILGPLSYDIDIFNNNLIDKLEKWDHHELSIKIETSLKNKSDLILSTDVLTLIDYNANMLKLERIFHSLTNNS